MSRPIAYDPRQAARNEVRAMRALVKAPATTRLARLWVWLNTPMKG